MAAAWDHPDLVPLAPHLDPHRRVLVIRASIGQVRTETWEKDTKLHQRRHLTLDQHTCAMLFCR
jgi:integrase